MSNTMVAIATAAKNWADLRTRTGKSLSVLIDTLISSGTKVGFNTAVDKVYNETATAVRDGIALSMGKRAYALFHTDSKDLSKVEGTGKYAGCKTEAQDRTYVIKQVGSRMNKVNGALSKRLNGDKKGADQNTTDDFTKLLELAVTSDKKLGKIENAKFDVIEAKEALALYITILNTKI